LRVAWTERADPPRQAAIALGSNLGDCRATLEGALVELDASPGIRLLRRSAWYRSAPVGPPQPDYLNGCAVLEVLLSPEALLDRLLETETRFGRVRAERWGPRTLDLDLILLSDLRLDGERLQLPHPRMRERAFVLVPLAEIAPDWIDPLTGLNVAALARQLPDDGGLERLALQS
jgi:2-amino-4-hydroxy-6-hydroxymethyldihydropteridine diphosphokinase